MKIGLIDIDGHNFPNLALMKISAYHKALGDSVEWVNYIEKYDKVYKSKVFAFSPDPQACIQANEIVRGGTGYDVKSVLPDEIDCVEPDYSIYPNFKEAYGFLTRGCIRKCQWCIVPEKEGYIKPYRDIESVLQGQKTAILMDNNILACNYGLQQLEKIADMKCRVDFNQGLDARLITDGIAELLSRISWIRYIRFACDTPEAVEPFLLALEKLNKYGVKNYRVFVYLLVKDVNEANSRAEIMKKLRLNPFAQPYRDFNTNTEPTEEQKKFARYVNRKEIFNSTDWYGYNASFSVKSNEKQENKKQLKINF